MIVYAGKQYGNDFNNGDEALFQDANRPRDDDKFKIRPGLQSDKRDFRGSNKDIRINAPEMIVQAAISAPSSNIYYIPPTLKQKEKVGDPGCIINKGGQLEIVEDGTYVIQASCEYFFGSTPANGYQYIENVALLKRNPKTGGWLIQTKTQGRACANTSSYSDQLSALYTGYFIKGTIFTVGASHTYSSNITLQESISIQRLS